MTDTELERLPAELPEPTPTDPWQLQFQLLRERFPKAQPSILFCVHALQQSSEIALDDLKAQATLHGLRVTGGSLQAARRLLGLAPPIARRKRAPREKFARTDDAAWSEAREALAQEFPKATEGILYCVFRLRQDPSLGLPDLRDGADELGIKVGGRALHSARALLGIGRGAAKARREPAASPRARSTAGGDPLGDLRDAFLSQQREIERLRAALDKIRRAVATLQD